MRDNVVLHARMLDRKIRDSGKVLKHVQLTFASSTYSSVGQTLKMRYAHEANLNL